MDGSRYLLSTGGKSWYLHSTNTHTWTLSAPPLQQWLAPSIPGLALEKHHHARLLHQGAAKVPLTQHSCARLAPCLWRTLILKKNNQLGLGRDGLFCNALPPPPFWDSDTSSKWTSLSYLWLDPKCYMDPDKTLWVVGSLLYQVTFAAPSMFLYLK